MQDLTQHAVPHSNLEPRRELGSADLESGARCAPCSCQKHRICAQRVMRLRRNPGARRCLKVAERIDETEDRNAEPRVWEKKDSRALPSPGAACQIWSRIWGTASQRTADANVNKLRLKSEVEDSPKSGAGP